MVHARVLDVYIQFALMYKTHHIFPVLPIKTLVNQDGEPTTQPKFANGKRPSLSNLRVLFCPCGVLESTSNFDRKALNMHHQSKTFFGYIGWNSATPKMVRHIPT